MASPDLGLVYRFVQGSGDVTLLLLHGTGGDETDLLSLGRYLDPDANLLSPRGAVLENGMPRFFKRLGMGVFDVPDLKQRTMDLARFVEEASEVYGLDREQIFAVGYSNGANIAASLLLMRPKTIRGAALLHAMVPFVPDKTPDLSSTSILVTGGRRDTMVPADQTEELAGMLRRAGAQVDHELQPGGHELTQQEVDYVRDWLSRVRTRDS